jgi:hypothetical protein
MGEFKEEFVVEKARKSYYFISLVFGLIYFVVPFFIRTLLEPSIVPTLDTWFIGLDGLFVVIFIIKDTLDEISMQRGGSPVGPTQFEHVPFLAMVAFHGIVLALTDLSSNLITLQWFLVVVMVVDIIWDLSQDIRAGTDR